MGFVPLNKQKKGIKHPQALHHTPLQGKINPSFIASKAVMAGHAQGKFWEMREKLLLEYKPITFDEVMGATQTSGLNLVQFENDLDDKKWAAHIKDDFTVARSLGVVGVSTYFINGVKLESSRREDLEQVIIMLLEND